MLVAAIKSGSPLAGKAVVYNEEDDSFSLTGVGAITATRLLEYEDHGLLQWADLVTREWTLETAAIKARAEAATAAATAAQAAAEAATREAAEAAAAVATEAAAQAAAEAVIRAAELDRIAPMPIIYEPPSTVPAPEEGIPAKALGFELGAASDRQARWVVFAEPAPGQSRPAQGAAVTPLGVTTRPDAATSSQAVPSPGGPQSMPPPATLDGVAGATSRLSMESAAAATTATPPVPASAADEAAGRRSDRRRALKVAERRREWAGARVRIGVYVLLAAAAALTLLLVERGGL